MGLDFQRNHQISVVADADAACWWREWLPGLFPSGARHARVMLQANDGWVEIKPDANHGMVLNHVTRPHIASGIWLKGPRSPRANTKDIALARLFLGHRFWHVSTWRVWVYRAVACAAGCFFLWPSAYWFVGMAPLLIKSPSTPRGLLLWAEQLGFGQQVLKLNKGQVEDGTQDVLDRMRSQSGN